MCACIIEAKLLLTIVERYLTNDSFDFQSGSSNGILTPFQRVLEYQIHI